MKRWPGVCILVLLFVLIACGGAGESTTTSGQQSVQVSETDFKITSSVTTFGGQEQIIRSFQFRIGIP